VGGELGDAYNEVHALHCMSHQYVQKQVFGAGASVCSDFAAGTFSAVLGATVASTCANCVAMKYSAANSSTVYTDCPAGKISAQMAPGDEIKIRFRSSTQSRLLCTSDGGCVIVYV
jgi:hypothetical protein